MAIARFIIPLLIATLLATHGARKKSLSPSGAFAALVVGTLTLSTPLRTFGISLLIFYLVGSRATKVGKELKARLEEGHEAGGGGYRTGWQVWCNSCSAAVSAVGWWLIFGGHETEWARALTGVRGVEYTQQAWCALDSLVGGGWSRTFVFAALGHFACCLGDTLASELGILSPTPPILITTLKSVPPGTNGGVSLYGLLASLAGGAIMGVTFACSLLIENVKCRGDWVGVSRNLVAWGAVGGLFGSIIDSLLGATIQRTRYSSESKRILLDEAKPAPDADIKVVSGINILTNNQINLVSSILTALLLAKVA